MNAAAVLSRNAVLPVVAAVLATTPAGAQQQIPPDADHALEALNASPRHAEWAMVRLAGGDSLRAWVVYPERNGPAPVVVVIHEIFGLTHWIRAVADQLAAEGFIAVAPDLLTMQGIPSDATGEPDRQAATAAVRNLDRDPVQRQIRAVAEHGMALPAALGVYSVMGFCWGGAASFEHASRYHDHLAAAVVYYGASPDEGALARVRVPVIGLYGGDDERVNATIPRARAALPDRYVARIYEDAGHGFLRQQAGREGANLRASGQAWPHALGFLQGAFMGMRGT